MDSALFWLLFNLVTIVMLAFFSMEEMACVSFNKVRLQFYVAQKSTRAIWIQNLLEDPSRLFCTTLIGVNVATFVGSECARRWYAAMGLSPDLAPLSQVLIVIIFGELAPMFAARRYAEHVALLGVPILYATSIVIQPFIYVLRIISQLANRLTGGQEQFKNQLLTKDELQKLLETQEEDRLSDTLEFQDITASIFGLRGKTARHVMAPLKGRPCATAQTTIQEARHLWGSEESYLLLMHKNLLDVQGIVFVKDILRASDNKKLRDFCRPPWFITENTPLTQILTQFRRTSENVAIVLNEQGQTTGFLTFDDILDEIFGHSPQKKPPSWKKVVDKTVEGKITLEKFAKIFGIQLPGPPEELLSEWLLRVAEHPLETDEVFSWAPFTFTIKETSLLGIVSIHVHYAR